MKYRRLSLAELAELEQEFVQFLVANGIPAGDWVKIKAEKPVKMEQLLADFSDMVLETVLSEARYLANIQAKELMLFSIEADFMLIQSFSSEGNFDFTEFSDVTLFLQQDFVLPAGVQLSFSYQKPFVQSREVEVFELLESDCVILKKK